MRAPVFRQRISVECESCGEGSGPFLKEEEVGPWRREHCAKHARGKCEKCGHWNDEHRDQSNFPEPIAGYHKEPLICGHAMGMGDWCGCGTVKD